MSGLEAAGTSALLAAIAIGLGVLVGARRPAPGPARSRRAPRLVWWPALAVGAALLLLVELVDVPGGLVLVIGANAALLAVSLKNLVWTGTPIVALGLVLVLAPTIVDGGMPVSREALASMGYANPPAALPGERHLEVPSDQLRALGDIVPLPVGWRPVSFGELILLVGLADVAYNAAGRRRGRRPSRSRDEMGIDPLAGLVVHVDPLEDEPTVVVLGEAGPELEARLRAEAQRDQAVPATARRRPAVFDVEAILDGDGDLWADERVPDAGPRSPDLARRARSSTR